MKILDFLEKIEFKNLKMLDDNSFKDIQTFYENGIIRYLPEEKTVRKWDTIINSYLEEDNTVLFIRLYGSAAKKRWDLIRRGFLTEHSNGLSYVFCDNFLAQYFYAMAIENYVPEYTDFRDVMINRQFPYGYRTTKEEKVFTAFPLGKDTRINSLGWKLAHIHPVNKDYSNIDYKQIGKTIFPLGEQNDWKNNERYFVRNISTVMSDEDIKIMKAHYLRFIHPFNYFLVPKKKMQTDDFNNNIGELSLLTEYMDRIQTERFGELYEKYKSKILTISKDNKLTNQELGSTIINLKCGFYLETKTKNKTKKAKSKPTQLDNVPVANHEIKIGAYVQKSLKELINKNILTSDMISNLLSKDYSKEHFNLNFPMLIEVDESIKLQRNFQTKTQRYWKESFQTSNQSFYVCSQWYESDRNKFTEWFNLIYKNAVIYSGL